MKTILDLHNIYYSYHTSHGETRALSNLSFSLAPGEFAAVVGPSGCGKSTIAAVLTGRCPRGAPILVQMPGGTLEVQVCRDDTILLTGDAVTVFCGTVRLEPCKAPPGVV